MITIKIKTIHDKHYKIIYLNKSNNREPLNQYLKKLDLNLYNINKIMFDKFNAIPYNSQYYFFDNKQNAERAKYYLESIIIFKKISGDSGAI